MKDRKYNSTYVGNLHYKSVLSVNTEYNKYTLAENSKLVSFDVPSINFLTFIICYKIIII